MWFTFPLTSPLPTHRFALFALKKRLMFNGFVGQIMQMNFTPSYATQYLFHDILWYVSLNFRAHHLKSGKIHCNLEFKRERCWRKESSCEFQSCLDSIIHVTIHLKIIHCIKGGKLSIRAFLLCVSHLYHSRQWVTSMNRIGLGLRPWWAWFLEWNRRKSTCK